VSGGGDLDDFRDKEVEKVSMGLVLPQLHPDRGNRGIQAPFCLILLDNTFREFRCGKGARRNSTGGMGGGAYACLVIL